MNPIFAAGAAYAEFRSRLDQLGDLNWTAIRSTDFSSPAVKEGKQAEFLVKDFVPWGLGIATVSVTGMRSTVDVPLSDEEFDSLAERGLDLDRIHGVLHAVLVAPRMSPPSQRLPLAFAEVSLEPSSRWELLVKELS